MQTMMARTDETRSFVPANREYLPAANTKLYRLLAALLKGIEVDPGYAYQELNLPTLQARCSELRKMGWPVRTIDRPHPRLINERTTYYLLDSHFRQWLAAHPGTHPKHYGGQSGRGKYTAGGTP